MIKYLLQRTYSGPVATIGDLHSQAEGAPRLQTLENPWRGNGHDSSIPTGMYVCKRVMSPHFGDTFEVANVPNRSHILFHAGNTEKDTLGCILLGMRTNGVDAIYDSRIGVKKFLDFLAGVNEFALEIRDPDV